MALNRRGNRVNSIIDDLTEAVELSSDNVKVFCLLGKCYEMKKMKSEAKAAFEEALKTEPSSYVARAALHRLRSLANHDGRGLCSQPICLKHGHFKRLWRA
ncbi:hypothetical protein PVK06_016380 [Gossypium arboreum]|uniref:Uncharacterized protein n=1 Tax=Gossypium arboreum TaxID=29729 RepID=A0ABR0Q0P9_GOSAR|nr:hypothetical protein PVK06_016380 [Gossypium arboreum]